MLVDTMTDIIGNFTVKQDFVLQEQMESLRRYANSQFKLIRILFKNTTPFISKRWWWRIDDWRNGNGFSTSRISKIRVNYGEISIFSPIQ